MLSSIYTSFTDLGNKSQIYIGSNHACSEHFHKCFELTFVLKGRKFAIINGKSFDVKENMIVFVPQYFDHYFSDALTCTDINFIPSLEASSDFSQLLNNYQLPIILSDIQYNKEYLFPIFTQLSEKIDKYSNLEIKGITNIIFARLIRHYPLLPQEKKPFIDFTIDVLNYIDNNYNDCISLESIANALGYSKYYVSRLFNQHLRINFKSYLNGIRVQQVVMRYQHNKTKSVTDLAHSCGFDSLNTFYRSFKNIYGITPKEYFVKMQHSI